MDLLAVIIGGLIASISGITATYVTEKQASKRDMENYRRNKLEQLALKIADLNKIARSMDELAFSLLQGKINPDESSIENISEKLKASVEVFKEGSNELLILLELHGSSVVSEYSQYNRSEILHMGKARDVLLKRISNEISIEKALNEIQDSSKNIDMTRTRLMKRISSEMYQR